MPGNMLLFFIEDEFCLALLNSQKLVNLTVDLVPDFGPSQYLPEYSPKSVDCLVKALAKKTLIR